MENTIERGVGGYYPALCLAIGRLFLAFGMLEVSLAAGLRLHLQRCMAGEVGDNKSLEIAYTVYGSMRLKAARDALKRMLELERLGPQREAFRAAFFAHIGHIEDLRDKLAHQFVEKAWEEDDGNWVVSDSTTSRSPKSIKFYIFQTSAVVCAAADLEIAAHRIGAIIPTIGDRWKEFDLSPPPWRYKPSMLKLLPQSNRLLRKARKPPPPPSQG
ncbi:MAG: hypothetical protein QOH04_680 [Sphingomonadales bacterium]|jgi:hypothetical protein|nr:hypothetical protein [Sphingomonadales bacterium]